MMVLKVKNLLRKTLMVGTLGGVMMAGCVWIGGCAALTPANTQLDISLGADVATTTYLNSISLSHRAVVGNEVFQVASALDTAVMSNGLNLSQVQALLSQQVSASVPAGDRVLVSGLLNGLFVEIQQQVQANPTLIASNQPSTTQSYIHAALLMVENVTRSYAVNPDVPVVVPAVVTTQPTTQTAK